jgi:hypothetical protein
MMMFQSLSLTELGDFEFLTFAIPEGTGAGNLSRIRKTAQPAGIGGFLQKREKG